MADHIGDVRDVSRRTHHRRASSSSSARRQRSVRPQGDRGERASLQGRAVFVGGAEEDGAPAV